VTESSDPMAAAGRGHMRTSHADREHAIDTLKAAFVQGRLTKDELDLRVGQAFGSKTYAELAALCADLPTELALSPSRSAQAQGLSLADNKVLEWAIACALSPLVPLAVAFVIQSPVILPVLGLMLVLDLLLGLPFLMIVVGTRVEARRQERRSVGSPEQLPPRQLPPGAGGRPLGGPRRGGPGHDRVGPGGPADETRADMRAHNSRARARRMSGMAVLAQLATAASRLANSGSVT
jgi:Domain of unknown function (DUF1707)